MDFIFYREFKESDFILCGHGDGRGTDHVRGWEALVKRVKDDCGQDLADKMWADEWEWSDEQPSRPFFLSLSFEAEGLSIIRLSPSIKIAHGIPSAVWAAKASAAYVVAEQIKIRKKLVEALTALLEAVKSEPAMNEGRKYDQLGIQVHNALDAAWYTPNAWECAGRKQTLPEPGECSWPTCGCDPQADKVIEALEESGALAVSRPNLESEAK